jgi:predicted ribosome quality control (RQC) complex YloA/Tae2 family protein
MLAPLFQGTIAEYERLEALRELRSRLKRESKRLKRRLQAVERDLEKAENADAYKRRAELLQGAYNQEIRRGATTVTVTDYFDPNMSEVEIEIEPRLSLQDNIDRSFHQYRRLSEATDRIESRLLETMELSDAVETARDHVSDDLSVDDVVALDRKLVKAGVLPRRRRQKQQRQDERTPYRQYRAPSGAAILVGRNSKSNDELTTRVARGRDIWLHARDWPGSHVVLRMNKGAEPRSDDLVDAAILAAHFSRGGDDSLIDVIWTYAKHVRKPKGAAPGLVTHSGGSNIAVRRDPKRLERVLASLVEQ